MSNGLIEICNDTVKKIILDQLEASNVNMKLAVTFLEEVYTLLYELGEARIILNSDIKESLAFKNFLKEISIIKYNSKKVYHITDDDSDEFIEGLVLSIKAATGRLSLDELVQFRSSINKKRKEELELETIKENEYRSIIERISTADQHASVISIDKILNVAKVTHELVEKYSGFTVNIELVKNVLTSAVMLLIELKNEEINELNKLLDYAEFSEFVRCLEKSNNDVKEFTIVGEASDAFMEFIRKIDALKEEKE